MEVACSLRIPRIFVPVYQFKRRHIADCTFNVASSIHEISWVPWLHKFPKTRNTDSETTFRSGRPEGGVARCQLAERVAEVIAMVSNTAVHRRLLKGLRKLFQFVDIPGFLMYSDDLTKQADILRVLYSVKCSLNQKECMPDAGICNTDQIKPIFLNPTLCGFTNVSCIRF
jgi:hypothetical protein